MRFGTVSTRLALICIALLATGVPAHASGARSWRLLSSTPAFPPTLALPIGVYDGTRQRVLVVDGNLPFGSSPTLIRAFTPSASPHWSIVTASGTPPRQRYLPSLVLDPVRDRLLLIGSDWGLPVDVWALELSGTPAWSRISGDGPSGRFGHSAIYDPVRDRVVVFGGWAYGPGLGYRSDVWAFPLATNTWTQVAIDGPAPSGREGHGALYDPGGRRMMVFGGHSDDGARRFWNDVWALSLDDPLGWTRVDPTGPAPGARSSFGIVYDPLRRRMLVHGGVNAQSGIEPDDLWALALDGVPTWSPIVPENTLRGRSYPVDVYDPVEDRLLACGGAEYPQTSALSLSAPNEWIAVDPPLPLVSPSQHIGSSVLHDSRRDRFLVIGGVFSPVDSATWEFDFPGRNHWQPIRSSKAPLFGFTNADHSGATAFDSLGDRILAFDGYQTWSQSAASPNAWTPLGPRVPEDWTLGSDAGIAIDTRRNRLLVTGGYLPYPHGAGYSVKGVWALQLDANPTWSRLGVLPVNGSYGHVAWYDELRDRLIILGGAEIYDLPRTRHSFGAVVWATPLDSTLQWTKLGPTSDAAIPGPPFAHAAFDERTGRIFLARDSTLWSREVDDAASWTLVDLVGDRPMISNPVAFDPQRKELIALFAPRPGSDRVEAWSLAVGGRKASGVHVASADELPAVTTLALLGTFPSPAVGDVTIGFRLPDAGSAQLEVFDLAGRRRLKQEVGDFGAGTHLLELAGSNHWDAGVYFARLRRGAEHRTMRMLLTR